MMIAADQLLQALPLGAYTIDLEGRITSFNQAAIELWGRPPEPGDLWCACQRVFQPDGRLMSRAQYPMARAIAEHRPIRGVEVVLERPDGARAAVMAYATPLHDGDGRLTGAVNLLVDLRDRRGDEEDAARLAAIVSSSDDAIISKTLSGHITTWNAGAERIFGYAAEEMIGKPIMTIIPRELHDEERDIIARISRGERIEHFETVRLTKDGRRVDISLTVSPMRDSAGRIIGASKVARDISDRRRAEETQRLLVDELNHRMKNTLATVQAIATQTLRRTNNAGDFVASFNGRIHALARAHSLLTGSSFQGAAMLQLVRDQLMLGGEDDPRISWSGPALTLEAQAALHLALVLHELGTNARKHGALSSPNGKVAVRWELHSNGGRTLTLIWEERGGPPVAAPTTRGFGSILIEQSLHAHGGEATMSYAEAGVSCRITLPLPELRQPLPLPSHAAESAGRRRTQDHKLAGKRILVIEDEPLIAMVLADNLTEAGCEVIGPAQRLQAAQALIEQETFDGALLDGNLAGKPVTELAHALRRRNAPFVFVTGYGREALPPGFHDAPMIEKPFTPEQVIAALERLFETGDNVVSLKRPGKRDA